MNAQTKIVKSETVEAKKPASSQLEKFDINDAHILRSKFLNNYSRIEIWICEYAVRLDCSNKKLGLAKKVEVIGSHNSAQQDKIKPLLEEFLPYIKFRGEIAHALISVQMVWNEFMIIYQDAGMREHCKIKTMGIIDPHDLKKIQSRLGVIAGKLQKLT